MLQQVAYMVIRSTKQAAAEVWVPGKAIALFLVASQSEIWGAFSRGIFNIKKQCYNNCEEKTLWENTKRNASWLTRFGGVLCVVKDKHITGGGLGGNYAWILGHVSGSVHFPLMIDLDLNFNFPTYRTKASKF